MANKKQPGRRAQPVDRALPKARTGIAGLDEITFGGLPRGRPTLICGSAGAGKTLFGMEFLVHGALDFDEPGVFIAFEESEQELAENVRSLGFDVQDLVRRRKLALDYVHVERNEILETGHYDLEGLFLRIGAAIDEVGAKRIVLDTIETLFGGLSEPTILRSELRRLFRWLKSKGVTAIVTGERGDGVLTRQGLEEYVSDCVIVLDHRVQEQVSTRRLRVVKYRGSTHGTNEYPFLIDESGITVLPVTALGLHHKVSDERVPTGVPELDAMLGGGGFYRGSSIMVSGTPGSGKTSLAAHFAAATCARGERCLYFGFEESTEQLVRNMRSIGVRLEPWLKKGLLRHVSSRPTVHGLEMHLSQVHRKVEEFDPSVVVIDPASTFLGSGSAHDAEAMLLRLVDFLKARGTTALLLSLTSQRGALEVTGVGISSIIDTWLLLRDVELGGERNRALYVLKSRGMPHSNQIREFRITSEGIQLEEVYVGPEGVLTGSMRIAQENRERAQEIERRNAIVRDRRALAARRAELESRLAGLRSELDAVTADDEMLQSQHEATERRIEEERTAALEHRAGTGRPGKRRPSGTRRS